MSYLSLPGRVGNYANTPHSAALTITGDVDIRAYIDPIRYTSAFGVVIFTKSNTAGNQRGVQLTLASTGFLRLIWSVNGIANIDAVCTVALPSTKPRWVRAALDVDDGLGNRVTQFFTSETSEEGDLLDTVTAVGTTSIHPSTADLEVGSANGGTSISIIEMKVYRAKLFNGINGQLVSDFDPDKFGGSGLFADMATGERWQVNQSGTPFAQIIGEGHGKGDNKNRIFKPTGLIDRPKRKIISLPKKVKAPVVEIKPGITKEEKKVEPVKPIVPLVLGSTTIDDAEAKQAAINLENENIQLLMILASA